MMLLTSAVTFNQNDKYEGAFQILVELVTAESQQSLNQSYEEVQRNTEND